MENKTAKTVIEVRDLTFTFGTGRKTITAVNAVNFDIYEEEIVAIVGESGSGKSTLARILLSLQPKTAGTVRFYGKEIEENREHWRMVQAVFQDPFASFNQFYTVKTLMFDCFHIMDERLTSVQKAERVHSALVSVRLEPGTILGKYPFELSGGQIQRLLIARIFIIRPRMLVADEPTSMIDASNRSAILDLLIALKKELKMCIVFITHDIGLAHYLSDRIFVMNRGQIVETGIPDEVIYHPRHPYTKKLLNDIPALNSPWIDV